LIEFETNAHHVPVVDKVTIRDIAHKSSIAFG
jgi:hypothetical protein